MPYCCFVRISSSSRCDSVPRPVRREGTWYRTGLVVQRTDNVTFLQVEPVQIGERAFRVAHFFERDIGRAARLLGISNPNLADSTVSSEQFIQILAYR